MSYDNHQISRSLQCHLEERDPSLSLKGHWCPSGLLWVHAGGGPGKRVFLTVLCESYVLLYFQWRSCIIYYCTMLVVFRNYFHKFRNILYNALCVSRSFHGADNRTAIISNHNLTHQKSCEENAFSVHSPRVDEYLHRTAPKMESKEYHDLT